MGALPGNASCSTLASVASARVSTPLIRPWHMTINRSDIPMTSPNSLETTTITTRQSAGDQHKGDASIGQFIKNPVDFVFRPDIDAACRLVDDEHLQPGFGKPARKNRFLLIAAREKADFLLPVGRLDTQAPDEFIGNAGLGPLVDEQPPTQVMAAATDIDVLGHRATAHDAFFLAVFRAKHD